jgi:hypothetical protein
MGAIVWLTIYPLPVTVSANTQISCERKRMVSIVAIFFDRKKNISL